MVELYLHSPLYLCSILLNLFGTGTILPFLPYLPIYCSESFEFFLRYAQNYLEMPQNWQLLLHFTYIQVNNYPPIRHDHYSLENVIKPTEI
jgi:hypothetical protein